MHRRDQALEQWSHPGLISHNPSNRAAARWMTCYNSGASCKVRPARAAPKGTNSSLAVTASVIVDTICSFTTSAVMLLPVSLTLNRYPGAKPAEYDLDYSAAGTAARFSGGTHVYIPDARPLLALSRCRCAPLWSW